MMSIYLGGIQVINKLLGIPPRIDPMFIRVVASVNSFPYMDKSSFMPLTYALLKLASGKVVSDRKYHGPATSCARSSHLAKYLIEVSDLLMLGWIVADPAYPRQQ